MRTALYVVLQFFQRTTTTSSENLVLTASRLTEVFGVALDWSRVSRELTHARSQSNMTGLFRCCLGAVRIMTSKANN